MVEEERNETLYKAVGSLPEIQRRRFLLYYEYEFNFYQIAAMEHCTASAIQKSVAIAKEKVKAEIEEISPTVTDTARKRNLFFICVGLAALHTLTFFRGSKSIFKEVNAYVQRKQRHRPKGGKPCRSYRQSTPKAFYGIPAVLIAECKSRIDKGLMTDVLDEFDHVLGRSVDTYSDEVDETQANQMIEAAIDQYYIQQDKNGMLLFMEVMVTRMQQAGEVIVPYITENPFMSEEQISKVKAGDTISLDHDVRLKIETVKDADEKEWIGVFTSSEEMHKGSAGNVQMNQSIESILRLALNWEQVNGIVINPFGKYIQMTKKMIELLINGYEYNENERKSKDDENN
ncbi:SseB protein N-terminal domain-containing protein [Hespellia stercorisuis DSM 15480]|uniref:SseB protein N-terminal domain-containing protein n=1 Tax=Hespellia stercorisuis DSM 15480 TaxID=1121950 RepID=A0A1M6LPE5_9FIRM|nr:SseB protein N-terminal domain-containing protein [Hespellia stercorisuis DSM 15480]